MKILSCGNSEGSGFRNAWTGIKNVKGARPLNKFWNFIGAIQMISCRVRLVTWTKPGYITMTRRQSNNVLSGGVASYPTPPPKIPNDNIHWKISRLDSFGIKTTSSSLIIFQRTKLSIRSINHLCWCNWRTFRRKKAAGRSPRLSCCSTTMSRLTGHLQPRRNWPTWITHPLLRT